MEQDHRAAPADKERRRVKNIDWLKARQIADSMPGEAVYIGIVDQSMRTHIRKGRFSYINPNDYDVWTRLAGDRSQHRAHLFMRRKCEQE